MWDEKFSQNEYFYGTKPNEFLVSASEYIPSGRVLCLADGEGCSSIYLAEKGFAVTAVDSSFVGLEKAVALAKQKKVKIETVHADPADFNIEPDSWEGIVSIFTHFPKNIQKRINRRTFEGLKKGGTFILESYPPKQLEFNTGKPPTDDLMFILPDLKRELRGLIFLIAQETEREIIDENGHTGAGAVIQILGKKDDEIWKKFIGY